mmetsp:Transcript_46243/g.100709  ORF Transcript_46243/g.100709 Transcript_46243/m.100709 type:complete len:128 (+) Transcript_46243:47-430(+)
MAGTWLRALWPMLIMGILGIQDKDFDALLDNMDLSRDGTIHWHEVMHSEGFEQLPKDVKKKFQKAFVRADRDEDLVLTLEEFKHFYRDTERIMQERDLKLVNEARARLEAKKKATAEAEAQQKGKEL